VRGGYIKKLILPDNLGTTGDNVGTMRDNPKDNGDNMRNGDNGRFEALWAWSGG